MTDVKYYKLLMDGQSMNGGGLQWSLPRKRGKDWQPGDWHEVKGKISLCNNGLHLTTEPYQAWYKWGCTVYEAEGSGESETDGSDKTAFQRARLLRPASEPEWLLKTKAIIADIQEIKWLQVDGSPKPEWKLFPTRDAARNAAGDAAWNAARNALIEGVCSGLPIDEKHHVHIRARMEVWQKGYGLLCDVDGVLYVYERIS